MKSKERSELSPGLADSLDSGISPTPVVLEDIPVRTKVGPDTTSPSFGLGIATELDGTKICILRGGEKTWVALDPSVDPALIVAAIQSKSRVVVEGNVVVGLLMTANSLTIDRQGNVDAELRRFSLAVKEEVLLKTKRAFLRIRGSAIEQYAHEIRIRARDVVRALAGVIRLN